MNSLFFSALRINNLFLLTGILLYWGASHMLNVAVQEVLQKHRDIFEQVRKLMIKLGTIIPAAKLRTKLLLKQL